MMWRNREFKVAVLTAVLTGAAFFCAGSTLAAGGFSLYPAKTEIVAKPGQIHTGKIFIKNNLGRDAIFVLSVRDLDWNGASGSSLDFGLKDFISLANDEAMIPAGATGTVVYDIMIPAGFVPSAHYGAVIASVSGIGKGEAKTVTSIGSTILLKIDGPIFSSGKLTSFGTAGSAGYIIGPSSAKLLLSFKNDGNVHLNPYGLVELKNIFGRRAALLEIKPWTVLPKETRILEQSTRGFLFGFYKATVYLNRGYDNIVDIKKTSFWIWPWWFIGLVGTTVLVGVICLIRRGIKNYEKIRRS